MAYLNDIVSEINAGLKAKLTAFPKALYAGVASQIARKKGDKYEYLPAEVDDKGEAKWMTFDDVKDIAIYHRIANSSYTQVKNQSYGDGNNEFQHQTDLDLIVMADRRKVQVTPEVLESAIASNIEAKAIPTGLYYLNVLTVSANHSSRSVFGSEFVGVDYYLRPEHILFSIRYRIELRYQKGCLSLCQC